MVGSPKIRILSAGAPKAGVRLCAEANLRKSGDPFDVEFATAPTIHDRLAAGTAKADVIVAPCPLLEKFAAGGAIVAGSVVELGSVAAAVAVRNGAREPDLGTVEGFRKALLAADVLIYNRASSGQYIGQLIESLGIARSVAGKTVRTDTGRGVMEYLAQDRSERPIAFGQMTEIRLQEHLGIHLVGPLPRKIGKKTSYCAGLAATATDAEAPRRLLELFRAGEGRRILRETGVD